MKHLDIFPRNPPGRDELKEYPIKNTSVVQTDGTISTIVRLLNAKYKEKNWLELESSLLYFFLDMNWEYCTKPMFDLKSWSGAGRFDYNEPYKREKFDQ